MGREAFTCGCMHVGGEKPSKLWEEQEQEEKQNFLEAEEMDQFNTPSLYTAIKDCHILPGFTFIHHMQFIP